MLQGAIMILVSLAAVASMCAWKLHSRHTDSASKFTPEQREVLSQLRSAQAQLAQTKADIERMLSEARSATPSTVTPQTPDGIQWTVLFDGNVHTLAGPNGPVLWGLCPDGTVRWKMP
jgi:hypothetical protein